MSADNGVYILVSLGRKGRHGHKKEYRVIHKQAIECITMNPNFPKQDAVLNSGEVVKFFGKARVFTDRRIAKGYAQGIYDAAMTDFGYVEYGIVWLEDFAHLPFPGVHHRPHRRTRQLATAG